MAEPEVNPNVCLATVTSESFMPGTMVLLHSFLRHNRWFKGDIVIIHYALAERYKSALQTFPNVRFLEAGDALREKISALDEALPGLQLNGKERRFYSLEVFRLTDYISDKIYKKVIFCDSDILFLGDISPLVYLSPDEHPGLIVGGDRHYLTGTAVHEDTFLPVEKSGDKSADQDGIITKTFAAGFFIANHLCLTHDHYNALLDQFNPDLWRNLKDSRTVHVVLNRYFKDQCLFINPRYHFPAMHEDLIRLVESIDIKDIKILHFNWKAKPWQLLDVVQQFTVDPSMLHFLKLWHNAYLSMLPEFHLHYLVNAGKLKENR